MERGNIIRPVLNIPRKTIQEFASNHAVAFREDSSNASTKYLRNKIRHLLIPELKNEYDSVADDFQFISSLSRAESKLYLSNFQTKWETEVLETYDKSGLSLEHVNIPTSFYTNQDNHSGLKNKFLSWGFTNNQVNEILNNPINIGSHWIGREFVLYTNRNGLTLKKRNNTEITETKIRVNEVVYFGNFQINMVEINVDQVDFNEPNCYYFNPSIGNEEPTIRSWRVGDKMQPLGMKGTKKVSDIFINSKIDNDRKNDFPLLVSNAEIFAILGLKRSTHFLLGESETAMKISWDTLN
jgi:tRNA(Ile)-lysidine synthase